MISPRSSGSSHCSFCSGVPPIAISSLLPESGAWLPKMFGATAAATEDLVHQRELHLAVALPAELGIEVARPQAAVLHLLLERCRRARPRVVGHVVVEERERLDLLVDEGAHPLELRRELRVGREIPRHGAEYKVAPWGSSRAAWRSSPAVDGASGARIALRYAREGATVVISSRTQSDLDAVVGADRRRRRRTRAGGGRRRLRPRRRPPPRARGHRARSVGSTCS